MLALNENDRDQFLQIQKKLILFTNKKFNIYNKFTDLASLEALTESDLRNGVLPIRKKMYDLEHLRDFCNSEQTLSPEAKEICISWSNVYSGSFYLMKHLKDYSVLMVESEKKLYGVVGISSGLDDCIPSNCLPMIINTMLIPFKDKIVYDGFFAHHSISFGGNITRSLNATYSNIKNTQGIIHTPLKNTNIVDLAVSKSNEELITYHVKSALKAGYFPNEAWSLIQNNEENRVCFEQEFAKFASKHQKKSLKNLSEIKKMHYGMYRSCIIAVAETKKSLLAFCEEHYPELSRYIYVFKA